MLTSLHPTSPVSPTSDKAVRDLLDQRARASHTRYTSVSFSQHSDSPSLYSRGDISPGPLSPPLGDLLVRSGNPTPVASHSASNNAEETLRRPPSAAGSVDSSNRYLPDDDEKDNVSFVSASTPKPFFRQEADPPRTFEPELESLSMEMLDDDSRMSLLGPKMRFVSRAPWEAEEKDLEEEDEGNSGDHLDSSPHFDSKIGRKSKDSDKISVKGLALATLRSHSPGPPSVGPKKSMMNMILYRYKSPDSTGGSPYGPHLSNASQSHSAISTLSSARSSHSISDSQSSSNLNSRTLTPRVVSRPTSPVSQVGAVPPLPSPKANTIRTPKVSSSSHDDSSSSSFRSDSPPPVRYVHPYANPDLLPSTGPSSPTHVPRTPRKNHDHSSEERDRRFSMLHGQSESSESPPRIINGRKVHTADATVVASHPRNADRQDGSDGSRVFAHGQTSVSMGSTSPKALYPEQSDSPMKNLITLEQARARAQNPFYTKDQDHTLATRSAPKSTLVAGLGLAPGVVVESGVIRGQSQRSAAIPFPQSTPSPASPQGRDLERQRTRTTSFGRNISGSSATRPGDDTAPTRTLKHKKSAFMKFFQGGKDKEREKDVLKELPPATRSPTARTVSTPTQTNSKDQSKRSLHNEFSVKRAPPPLSVVVTSPSIQSLGSLATAAQGSIEPSGPPGLLQAPLSAPSRKHEDLESSDQLSDLEQLPPQKTPQRSTNISPLSSSAPSSKSEFKALSLRPVSTIFSANFSELLSTLPPSNAPWNKNSNAPSPTTPGFDSSRSNSMSTASDYPITPTSAKPFIGVPGTIHSPTEDPSTIIATLQEQVINSRKAWQRQIWELEGQVKDLKAEIEELRNTGDCETCGKAKRDGRLRASSTQGYGVVHRPRPRLGGDTRSVFGGGSDI